MSQQISNRNTQQTPITTLGLTGAQLIKMVPASRFYIKSVDVPAAVPIVKSNGTTLTGWTDLGIIDGAAKTTYQKDTTRVEVGIEKILEGIYTTKKAATIEVNLQQFDDTVLAAISGLTPSTITTGSIVSFPIGSEFVVQKAILLVSQNVLDGKEMQFYNPQAFLSFNIDTSGDMMSVKATIDLPLFSDPHNGNISQVMALTILS
jgi:hypothetical protein